MDYNWFIGIGPEISQSVKDIYTAAGVRDFRAQEATKT